MTDFSFTRIYMPAKGRTAFDLNNEHSVLLNQECIAWLNENCGPRAQTYHEWILGLPENKHGWYFIGFDYDPSSDYVKTSRVFLIRNEASALLFKLAWGG